LERRAPQAYRSLVEARPALEQEFRDMEDFEFTIEEGRLFVLQSRTGKRTPLAALRIAHDLAEQGLISKHKALARIDAIELGAIDNACLKPAADRTPLARGTSASMGVAIGAAVFDPERAATVKKGGRAIVPIRENAETSDIGALS
jgi:pyruvate,orthophosphate dikinase